MECVYRVRNGGVPGGDYVVTRYFHDEYEAKKAIEDCKANGVTNELSPIPLPENKKQFVAFLENYKI